MVVLLSACVGPAIPPATTTTTLVDADGDGVDATLDCDDADDTVLPGAPEDCDERDTDCDPATVGACASCVWLSDDGEASRYVDGTVEAPVCAFVGITEGGLVYAREGVRIRPETCEVAATLRIADLPVGGRPDHTGTSGSYTTYTPDVELLGAASAASGGIYVSYAYDGVDAAYMYRTSVVDRFGGDTFMAHEYVSEPDYDGITEDFAVDPEGWVYVLRDGEILTAREGEPPVLFASGSGSERPRRVEVGPDALYVLDEGGAVVRLSLLDGAPLGTFVPGDAPGRSELVFLPDGRLLVADSDRELIEAFSPAGDPTGVWASGAPRGERVQLAVGPCP